MSLKYFVPFLFLSFIGCSSFHTVPGKELESKELVGSWSTGDSGLNIYCTGAISFDIKHSVFPILFDNAHHTCSGCVVNKINSDHLLVGPFITSKLKVTKWPYHNKEKVQMVLEDQTWTRINEFVCSN